MPGRAGLFFLGCAVLLWALLVSTAFAEPLDLRYPVVMVHGIFHSENAGDSHPYFRGVAKRFHDLGIPVTFPGLGFSNGVASRAEKLAAHIRATYPTGKVNIIAHSIGGLAARDAIARLGLADRVASLTMVSTPHRGTPVADWVIHSFDHGLVAQITHAAGFDPQALRDLTEKSCAEFNARTPDAPGVAYFSMGGAQLWYRISAPLQPFTWLIRLATRARAGLPVDPATRARLLTETWGPSVLAEVDRVAALSVNAPPPAPDDSRGANDGVVPLTSTPWGTSFGSLDMDHLDEIGWHSNGQEAADLYEWIARSLAARGY